jgi:hypothetical protein
MDGLFLAAALLGSSLPAVLPARPPLFLAAVGVVVFWVGFARLWVSSGVTKFILMPRRHSINGNEGPMATRMHLLTCSACHAVRATRGTPPASVRSTAGGTLARWGSSTAANWAYVPGKGWKAQQQQQHMPGTWIRLLALIAVLVVS